MNWIKKNKITIIIVLLSVFGLFKSCESCSRGNRCTWIAYQTTQQIDSLNRTIDSLEISNKNLSDSIHILNSQVNLLEEANRILSESNRAHMDVNRALARAQQNLNKSK